MPAIAIKGSAALVIKKLESVPATVESAIAAGLARGLLYAVSVSQRSYLSGPRPQRLDVRTRRLRNSIVSEVEIDKTLIALDYSGGQTHQRTTGTGNITGRLGSNVEYAAYHEFGFHGVVNVQAHSRILGLSHKSTGAALELRRSWVDAKGNRIGWRDTTFQALQRHQKSRRFIDVARVTVSAHQRHLDYSGRPYVKPALEESLPTITEEINKGLKSV